MLSQLPLSDPLIRVQSWARGASAPESAERLLGLDWPFKAGDVVRDDRVDVICIGPTDWLVVAASAAGSDRLLHALEEAFRGSFFRATDFSAALARIRIGGAHGRALLSKACALDVYSGNLAPGRAPRTLIAGLPVVIRCLESDVFECLTPLSYADYLMTWLTDANAEFTAADLLVPEVI
jgi:sarcosine oxidase subunit gamma